MFSTCSPNRPNLIGLHRARVVVREGLRIEVDALEAIDGTPVVDVQVGYRPVRMTRCTLPATCVAGQVPRSMEPELIVDAAVLRGAAWADRRARAEGPVMAESRWPVVLTAVLPSRGGMPLLRVLIVFIVRWHG